MLVRCSCAAFLLLMPACAGDSIAVVARVHRASPASSAEGGAGAGGSTGGFDNPSVGDATDAVRGPGGFLWWPYIDDKSPPAPAGTLSSEWLNQPTVSSVSVSAKHPRDYRAGLAFKFFDDNSILDLTQFSSLEVTVDLFDGDRFELFLGRGPNEGCSYVFNKERDKNVYGCDLASASWCVPSQCGFNLQVTGGLFLAHVPSDSPLVASLSDLHFYTKTAGIRAGSASGLEGRNGPGGFCWFLGRWNQSGVTSVSWDSNPTSSSAEATAYSSVSTSAGIDFELPRDMKLSQYRTLILDATLTESTSETGPAEVILQAVKQNSGRGWYLTPGDGKRRDYSINLTDPHFPFGPNSPVALDDVERFEFVNRYGGRGIRVKVQGVQFLR